MGRLRPPLFFFSDSIVCKINRNDFIEIKCILSYPQSFRAITFFLLYNMLIIYCMKPSSSKYLYMFLSVTVLLAFGFFVYAAPALYNPGDTLNPIRCSRCSASDHLELSMKRLSLMTISVRNIGKCT
jgi:hypothetical protein